jgi:endonuclease/exonuclease/phosphatase family metal-dependent hydrolase
MRRVGLIGVLITAALGVGVTSVPASGPDDVLPSCPARASRIGDATIHWIPAPQPDLATVEQWCRAVGTPLYLPAPAVASEAPPALEDLVVITWNAHLAEGRVDELVGALREGRFTDGRPVTHFVLLIQELYRRGTTVPVFVPGVRSAYAIRARDLKSSDAMAYATRLGLAMLYVPSMRNGAELLEDRGNAILSTEPLSAPFAIELPFERQRRVAIGAAIAVDGEGTTGTLRLIDAHLDPLSSPRSLWVFRNPRTRQMGAILDLVTASRFEDDVTWAGTALGGDFNTIQAGTDETAYEQARAWSSGFIREDRRLTHTLGKIDHLFFRLPPGRGVSTTRLNEKFGSDHYPVMGQISAEQQDEWILGCHGAAQPRANRVPPWNPVKSV